MNGSPAKLGTIKGTTGHSSALKQKKREDVEKKIKAEQDFMGKKNWTENELIKMGPEKRKKLMDLMKKGSANDAITKIKGIMDKVKHDSPAKQKVKYEKAEPAPRLKKEQLEQKVIKETTGKLIVKKKSPAKQKQQSSGIENVQKQQTSEAAQLLRQKQIDAVDAKIETLEEQIFNEEITQEQYDEAMKSIRVKEKQVKKPL